MKKPLLLALLYLLRVSGFAQETAKPFAVSIGIGLSQPAGRFSKAPASSVHDNNGNALTGFGAQVQLQYQLKNRLGFTLLAGGTINGRNEKRVEENMLEPLGNNAVANANLKSWKVFKVMPGVFYSIPLGKASHFELMPMIAAGICKTAVPAESGGYSDPDLPVTGSYKMPKRKLPVTFCYQFGAELKYNLNETTFLTGNIAYFNANPVEKYSYNVGGNNTTPGTWVPAEKKYSLASLNAQVGIGVRF